MWLLMMYDVDEDVKMRLFEFGNGDDMPTVRNDIPSHRVKE